MADGVTTLHIYAEDYPAALSWQLARWCQSHGADDWTVHWISVEGEPDPAEHFDAVMHAYYIGRADRVTGTAYHKGDFVRFVDLWQLTVALMVALQEFLADGLFTYDPGRNGWIEDPVFYRKGEMMLGIVSHEGYGLLRVTEQEQQELEKAGFPYHP